MHLGYCERSRNLVLGAISACTCNVLSAPRLQFGAAASKLGTVGNAYHVGATPGTEHGSSSGFGGGGGGLGGVGFRLLALLLLRDKLLQICVPLPNQTGDGTLQQHQVVANRA